MLVSQNNMLKIHPLGMATIKKRHCDTRHNIFFSNVLIPNYMFPDTLISRIQSSRPRITVFTSPRSQMMRDTPFGSGGSTDHSNWGIREINVVGISAFGKKTWSLHPYLQTIHCLWGPLKATVLF